MPRDDALEPTADDVPVDQPHDGDAEREAAARPELTGPREALTGAQDQDNTRRTGPGTGGATESPTRTPRHSGAHVSNSAKG
jgi:hypothetical protein